MKRIIAVLAIILIAIGVAAATAQANGQPPKVKLCHNGNTIEVSLSAVFGHLLHGDKLGACPAPPPVDEEDPPVYEDPQDDPILYVQENRTGYCANIPQFRVGDGSWGIYVDLLTDQPVPYGYVPAFVGPNGETYC